MTADAVLSLGANAELLWLREVVLQHAGFNVFSTSDPKQAVLEIQSGHCGVLLLCHSLENEVRRELANEFRKWCPEGRIVAVTNDKVSELHCVVSPASLLFLRPRKGILDPLTVREHYADICDARSGSSLLRNRERIPTESNMRLRIWNT